MQTTRALTIKQMFLLSLAVMLFIAVALPVSAQDEEDPMVIGPAGPFYVPLQPALVLNYGGQGRLKYLRTEISVRVDSIHVANAIRHHLPYIRNNLVMLFSRQSEETVNSMEGRETLRKKALAEIKSILTQEERNAKGVEDLFFTNFVVQK